MNIKVDLYLIISLIILFFFKQLDVFLSFYVFVILHEFAHILVAVLLKIKLVDISFLPFGVNAKFEFGNHKIKEIIIALAGPVFSLILAILVETYEMQNVFICITNLIPIYPLDGGRILKNLIIKIYGKTKGTKLYNYLLRSFIIVLLIINILIIVFFRSYKFIFFSIYIIQMAGDEIKKDKIRMQMRKILNVEI